MDIKLFDDDLWIYISDKISLGCEKEDDNIFHRVNIFSLHIQWWNFPNKNNFCIRLLTFLFNILCSNPTIHPGSVDNP